MSRQSFSLFKNKASLLVLILALITGGVTAQANELLKTTSSGYLVCVDSKTKIVTHPGTSKCPKGSKKIVLGSTGVKGLTGAAGLPGKDGKHGLDGKTLWNGVKDPESTWGAPGDMFINAVTKTLFGPKDLTTGWPAGVSMVGPKGDQGPIGLTGATGPQGPGGSGPAGPAGSNATLTCAQGGTCVLGDIGPGGGKVFIVQTATAVAPWRYMEAAPNTWSGGSADPVIVWCSNTSAYVPNLLTGSTTGLQTSIAIGAGYANTQKMLRGCTYGAANAAAAYNGGGKTDWHLPSKDQLNQMYLQRGNLSEFLINGPYMTSSEVLADTHWSQWFNTGEQANFSSKTAPNGFYVRPVRAF